MIGVILIFQAYASRTLACEQALCLGKGRKNREERVFFTLCPNRKPFHRLVEGISLMPSLCLSLRTLIHARKHANKLLIQCGSANQEFTDASVHRNEQNGVLIAGFSYPLSLSNPPPFFPIPYPLNFDGCFTVNGIACMASFGAKKDLASDRRRISDLRLFPSSDDRK